MRPNRSGGEDDRRYRRSRNNGGLSATKIALFVIVAVGIVATALIVTNSYEFGADPEPVRIGSGPQAFNRAGADGVESAESNDSSSKGR